jgi:hypothetical protein
VEIGRRVGNDRPGALEALTPPPSLAPVRAEAVRRIREIIRLQQALTGRDVVVVPVLISTGCVSREKFPADLAGLPIRYNGEALLPPPGLARWIEARVARGPGLAVMDARRARAGGPGRDPATPLRS